MLQYCLPKVCMCSNIYASIVTSMCVDSAALRELRAQEAMEVVHCIAKALDIIGLVNNLPANVLWGGRITSRKTALMGLTSNLVGLYTVSLRTYCTLILIEAI